jgi:hypothetical protein
VLVPASGASASANPTNAAASSTAPSISISPISVSLPTGKYLVWLTQGATSSTPALAGSGQVALQPEQPGPGKLWVVDPMLNRVGTLDAQPGANVDVSAASLGDAYAVVVQLEDRNKQPLDYARVDLTDIDRKAHTLILSPADGGRLIFTKIPFGDVTITATRSDGAKTMTATIIQCPPTPIIVPVEVVTTLSATAAAGLSTPRSGPARKQSIPAPKSGSPMSSLTAIVVLLIVAGGVLYVALNYERIRPRIQDLLRRMGGDTVDLQGAPGATGWPAPGTVQPGLSAEDSSVCAFCGTRKDPATGSCACTLVPAGAAAPASADGAGTPGTGPHLVAVEGPARGQIFPLSANATVGREPNNSIAVPSDTAISRRHARFAFSGSEVELVDEGSSNGTFVNGAKITQQVLHGSDEIQIGHSRFRFEP